MYIPPFFSYYYVKCIFLGCFRIGWESLKGREVVDRKAKRGDRDQNRGISNLKIAVVVAQDRNGQAIAQKNWNRPCKSRRN